MNRDQLEHVIRAATRARLVEEHVLQKRLAETSVAEEVHSLVAGRVKRLFLPRSGPGSREN